MSIIKRGAVVCVSLVVAAGVVVAGGPLQVAAVPPVQPRHDVIGLQQDGTLYRYENHGGMAPLRGTGERFGDNMSHYPSLQFADLDGDGRAEVIAYPKLHNAKVYRSSDRWGAQTDYRKALESDIPYRGGVSTFAKLSYHGATQEVYVDNGKLYAAPVFHTSDKDGRERFELGQARQIGHGWGDFTSLMAGDITGDGLDDIVGVKKDHSLWLYETDGAYWAGKTSVFKAGVRIGTGWHIFDTIMIGDINGDGRADAVGRLHNGTLRYYVNTGNAAWPFGAGSRQIGSGFNRFKAIYLAEVVKDK